MGKLTKSELRSRAPQAKRRYREVALQDGNTVELQSMTRFEQRKWRKATQKNDGTPDPAKVEFSNDILLAMTIVDDQRQLAFTVADAVSGIFNDWDTADTSLLVDAAVDHCGLVVDAKEINDSKNDKDETPGNGSSGNSSDKPD